MSLSNTQLLQRLDELLQSQKVKDYCPNGLQIEGKSQICKIVTGVTASKALIEQAITMKADAILVHHGYFWKGESAKITGMKRERIKLLLGHNINLYAYHLPLDIHPQLGNNAQLAALLGIENIANCDESNPHSVVMHGQFKHEVTPHALSQLLTTQLNKKPLHEPAQKEKIKTVAWCTGGGQGFIELAAQKGIDAYITGEVSEQTIHVAREMNIHFYAAGHHATERYGVKALGEYIHQNMDVEVVFIDIDNPA